MSVEMPPAVWTAPVTAPPNPDPVVMETRAANTTRVRANSPAPAPNRPLRNFHPMYRAETTNPRCDSRIGPKMWASSRFPTVAAASVRGTLDDKPGGGLEQPDGNRDEDLAQREDKIGGGTDGDTSDVAHEPVVGAAGIVAADLDDTVRLVGGIVGRWV